LEITQSPAAGETISGTTGVTLIAIDDAGNSASVQFNVVVDDQTAPVVSSIETQNLIGDSQGSISLPAYIDSIEVSDNCSSTFTKTQVPAAGTSVSGNNNTVSITVADENNNETTISFVVNVSVYSGIETIADTISIYPNPAAGIVNISTSKTVEYIKVYNTIGELVINQKGNIKTVDLSNLNRGLYIINIGLDQTTYTTRIVKN